MRAGLSTIQQTLTPEAVSVLNHSIAEASRRNHGQTTPLHVAATLLASPSGFLRQACIKSHPNSSHPLQCRALELCFSVALERLPTAQNLSPGHDPPISNALMAALKRAQAHQRRGCPEQQQQPLLAVKVELEQLIVSILDDPSVSRVMREASFSSPAVKATIEQSLNSSTSNSSAAAAASNSNSFGFGFRTPGAVPVPAPATNRNLYVNPRLQQGSIDQSGQQRNDEIKRVVDILLKNKRRNPVLVGESEPEMVVRELLKRIENKEIADGLLKNVHVIHLEKDFLDKMQIPAKIIELGGLIDSRIANLDCGGVILDLGDLKWLVEQPLNFAGAGGVQQQQQQQKIVSEAGRAAVAEMGKLLAQFAERSASGGGRRIWLIGTATCETYLRCQVYHPSMENDWDLQAVPIAPRAPLPGMFPRLGTNGILSNSVESFSPLKGLQTITPTLPRRLTENLDPAQRMSCCPQCMQNYEQELAKLTPKESEVSSSEFKSETNQLLPPWLKNAKSDDTDAKSLDKTVAKDQESSFKHKSLELQKKWHDKCLLLHPVYHQSNVSSERITQPALPMMSLYNANLLSRQPLQPKLGLNRNLGGCPQLNPNLFPSQPPGQAISPPGSPVRTDLVLGRPKSSENTPEKGREECIKDFSGCVASEQQIKLHDLQANKLLSALDADSFKRLLKGLLEKVWWQEEVASAVATTVTQCKLGNGKPRGNATKGDIWLLFTGPDEVGKKKMASAISELVFGSNPVMVSLSSRRDAGDSDVNFRGKTALDRTVEAVRRNPFSVIMLEDIDKADMLVRGSIKRAMERGRLSDSHGREISLGNVIFILTANGMPDNLKFLSNGVSLDEKKLMNLASGGWQLRLSLSEKTAKRRANWLLDEERPAKPKKDSGSALSFDLNEAAGAEEDKADGSRNSSDLTIDHEDEHVPNNRLQTPTASSLPREFLSSVDDNIEFKPVDFSLICCEVSNSITKRFSTIISDKIPFEIQEQALEKIAGGLWLSQSSLEEWTEKVLVPSLRQLKLQIPTCTEESSVVVQLESDRDSGSRCHGDWLPESVRVVLDGL
ncbi:protein SUPPRESSOR OF MAX2 1 [Manihot esculenta]|uniref:Clp R domain-containing protein n=1 Tax=Manihot esculenta TaxID=3983 RepID=A0A2C9UNN7_MANES|nr:protein SUPPRESSOR OF MAX2 1 [Manihot esculenta]OAY31866.1 hypothetical protein MANES_14G147300v8 [Manihot esculenta]